MSHKSQHTNAPENHEFCIMMGVPAAGKSTVANRMFGTTHDFIDCDAIKKTHPDYNPEDPQALHAWSKDIEAGLLHEAFTNPTTNIVYDTTGTNHQRVLNYGSQAESAGYSVRVVFVTVPETESLRRNSLRPRKVPKKILLQKFGQITRASALVSETVEDFTTVDNSVVDETLLGA